MSVAKDFSCIGGLEKHIRIVKEMVLFPLMYGDVYAKFNLRPPRGLLFYGPPGTGKTLVASALATECSNSERKVSFISRKGSDCLSKWVGESEKKLEKIFSLIAELYDDNRGEVYEVKSPSSQKRRSFFKQLFLNGPDSLSDCSSQADLVQILSPKKLKGENNRKLRSYVYSSESNGLLGTNIKREYASGEGPPSKRQKLTSGTARSSAEKLFSSQMEDLVETIVRSTDEWPSHLLESLFFSLEFTIENNGDLRAMVNEYVVRYEELQQVKMRAKQEED
ncbi:atpase family aaa domain-containing protein 2 [Lasius niger]|uniref:Atpase family aaa domain-containing protein 2 n=1 Tax=Lasius niger TaxID=67767 RepID=A0A0J7NVT0_LASNI|nr:atpase family aaa domain-containing protein 2 [Lasius niger]